MEHREEVALADVLERQSELNVALARALQSVALTADRYDAELAAISERLAVVERIAAAAWNGVEGIRVELDGLSRTLASRTEHLA